MDSNRISHHLGYLDFAQGNGQGRFKDMAARTLLLKLERAGFIQLPKRLSTSTNGFRNRNQPLVAHATESVRGALSDLRPLP